MEWGRILDSMNTRGSINILLSLCLCGALLHSHAAAAEAPASGLATMPEETRAEEAAVRGAFEKFHAAIKAGQGKFALEMRSKESLGRMTEEQKASWRRRPPIRNYAPDISSVSLRTKTAGVYYNLKDSRGKLACSFDLFLLEDGQWKLHLTRVQDHAPDDLVRSFWLPPDTAPFIEDGEDWSKIETVPTGDPDWSLQAISDSVFLHIRFIHATDLPLPGSLLKNDPPPSEMIYTPGVSIGAPDLREGIRLSVGEVIGARTIQKKSQSFVSYSLTFRRRGDKSYSAHVDTAGGVLKILGRCINVRVPRETLTDIPLRPLRIWVTPKAPATIRELTVKDWAHRTPPPAQPAPPWPMPLTVKFAITRTPPNSDAVLDTAKQTMRALATRIAGGDEKAFDELLDTTKKLYRDIDYNREKDRLVSNIALMHAAFDILGEQAGKGNTKAFDALKRSLRVRHLSSFAPDAMGIAAAQGHAEALDILLHHDKHQVLKSTVVFALQEPAAKNNEQAIAFLLAVLEDPTHRALWYGAAQGLAAAKETPKIKAAIEKYEAANRKPTEPAR